MAYKTEELLNKSLKAIKEHSLYFIEDVVVFLPCSKKAFYDHKLHECDELKDLLEQNKINTKIKLRKKWENDKNATLQMALYKLLASETERMALAMEYHKHDNNVTVKFEYGDNDKDT